MAKADIFIQDVAGNNVIPSVSRQTEANATDILAGEPVKLKSAGSPYVIPLADNEPAIGTTTQMIGITSGASNHTASADGTVNVYMIKPGVIYRAKASTPANIDTQAKLDALVNDNVLFDLITGVFTVDENAGNAAVNGIQIVGGDVAQGEIYFTIRPAAAEGAIA